MQKQNSMDVIQIRCKGLKKPIPLTEFLQDSLPFNLTQEELNVKEALKFLYNENSKEPPLFEKFPDWRKDQPLIINCNTIPDKYDESAACFAPNSNEIIFRKEHREVDMVSTLAHELKHAEQYTKEISDKKKDNLGIQQIDFLMEAQAYAFGNYIQMLFLEKEGTIPNLDKEMAEKTDLCTKTLLPKMMEWATKEPRGSYKDLEQELIPLALDRLYHSAYKTRYDRAHPVQETDKGLIHIPEAFHLEESYAKRLLDGKLQEVPKENTLTFTQYLFADPEEKAKIMQRILEQENENGNSPLLYEDYASLLMFLKMDKNIDGMMALSKKRNKQGISWLPNDLKQSIFQWMNNVYPVEKVSELLKEAQKEPPAFSRNEISEILKDNQFWNPIKDSENTKNPDKLNEPALGSEAKIDNFFMDKFKLTSALLGGFPADKYPGTFLTQAVKFGNTEIMEKVLPSLNWGQDLKNNQKGMKNLFQWILTTEKAWGNQLSEAEKNSQQRRISQMLSMFLDLKGENGQPMIDDNALKKFNEMALPEKVPVVCQALKQYQKEHPEDNRFEKPQSQTHHKFSDNSESLTKKLSKYSEDGKNMAQDDTSKKEFSVAQQATILSQQSQH